MLCVKYIFACIYTTVACSREGGRGWEVIPRYRSRASTGHKFRSVHPITKLVPKVNYSGNQTKILAQGMHPKSRRWPGVSPNLWTPLANWTNIYAATLLLPAMASVQTIYTKLFIFSVPRWRFGSRTAERNGRSKTQVWMSTARQSHRLQEASDPSPAPTPACCTASHCILTCPQRVLSVRWASSVPMAPTAPTKTHQSTTRTSVKQHERGNTSLLPVLWQLCDIWCDTKQPELSFSTN